MLNVNGDGFPDLIRSINKSDGTLGDRGVSLNKTRRRDALETITNGFNFKQFIQYQSISEQIQGRAFYEPSVDVGQYPVVRAAPPAYLVANVSTFEGTQREQRFS